MGTKNLMKIIHSHERIIQLKVNTLEDTNYISNLNILSHLPFKVKTVQIKDYSITSKDYTTRKNYLKLQLLSVLPCQLQ